MNCPYEDSCLHEGGIGCNRHCNECIRCQSFDDNYENDGESEKSTLSESDKISLMSKAKQLRDLAILWIQELEEGEEL